MIRVVYFVQRKSDNAVKIGTTADFHQRMRQLGYEYGEIKLLGVMLGSYSLEDDLHTQFDEYRMERVSWRRYKGHAFKLEWFTPAPELMAYISENAKTYNEAREEHAAIVEQRRAEYQQTRNQETAQ